MEPFELRTLSCAGKGKEKLYMKRAASPHTTTRRRIRVYKECAVGWVNPERDTGLLQRTYIASMLRHCRSISSATLAVADIVNMNRTTHTIHITHITQQNLIVTHLTTSFRRTVTFVVLMMVVMYKL